MNRIKQASFEKEIVDKPAPFDGSQSATRLIIAMCIAEVFSMVGVFAFPALLPLFFKEWGLTNTEAGWINGIYFAGYTAVVPVLASLTDRVDPRRIYIFSAALGALASLSFALLAQGFWTALIFRALCGMGLAGTYIPGLKALVDRIEGKPQARAISFYTATFGMGTSLSFFATGEIAALWGWQWAFAIAGCVSLIAILIAATALHPRAPHPVKTPDTRLLDFRPVLRNRKAMAYILAYATHMWELFATRSWMVAFLTFSMSLQTSKKGYWSPSTIAALTNFFAMWASVGGAELAIRFGRLHVLTLIMVSSAIFGCVIGFTAALPYSVVAILCVLYNMFSQGDSAALHTGTIQAAEPARRGATLAVQSLIGFGSASVGPLVVGLVLDYTGGGETIISWGAAFIAMGCVVGMGPIILTFLDRSELPGRV